MGVPDGPEGVVGFSDPTDVFIGADGQPFPPVVQRALQEQREKELRAQQAVPSKGEQRRLMAMQLALAARGTEGHVDGNSLVAFAKAIDKFLASGPNS